MKIKLARLFVCTTALLCATAWSANANLITNGGFETGDFSGWFLFGDSSGFTGVGKHLDLMAAGGE